MAAPADVIRIAPEFAALDATTVIQPFIDDAANEINPNRWGRQANRAVTLLAAHALACSYPSLYLRPPTTDHVGPVTISYANSVAPRMDEHATTRFGLEFMRLRRLLGPSAMVV